MLKKITGSFLLAFHNIRSHFFHTLLSILGIVIGVAALVAILSLIDGMENFAKEQITKTTSLNAIQIWSVPTREVNGVDIRKDTIDYLSYKNFDSLKSSLKTPIASAAIWTSQGRSISVVNDTTKAATRLTAVSLLDSTFHIVEGRILDEKSIQNSDSVAIITEGLANILQPNKDYKSLLEKQVVFGNKKVRLIGVAKSSRAPLPELFYPITLMPESEIAAALPLGLINAVEVINVSKLKEEINEWLAKKYGKNHDFRVMTNEYRVEQATQGFTLFRIIMGMIVGISVLVGGIGVMNVLLISVTERTSEIGVRKAVGANKGDIILQFLSESIMISFLGSLSGLVIGILATMAFVPIIKSLTKMPFSAAYTWNTLIVVSVLAIFVGIVFGTYPAMRAARLDPVEAIRRE